MKQNARRDRPLRRAVPGQGDHALRISIRESAVRKLMSTMDWTNASGGSRDVATNWGKAAPI